MATGDREFMLRALESAERERGPLPDVDWETPDDLARMSIESFIVSHGGDPRLDASHGTLHLSGPGVVGHSAPLSDVSSLGGAWQRAVTAVAASLEGFRQVRGRVKDDIQRRSEIVMTAAPAPGSLVLHIGPKAPPLAEAEPNGQTPLLGERDRPLADLATERLIVLLDELGKAHPEESADLAAEQLRGLGPRVGSAIRSLAAAVEASNITLTVDWEEPERQRRHAAWTTSEATWVRQFVDGRDLDAEDVTFTGTVVTVSTAQRWRIDRDGEPVFLDASEVPRDVVHAVAVDDEVEVLARLAVRVQADGSQKKTYTLRSVRVIQPESLL